MSSPRTLKDTFFAALTTVQDYVALDGSLLQGAIIQDAEQLSPRLLDLIFGSDQLRAAFTVKHGSHLVLDKAKLLTFLTSKDFLPDSFTAFSNKIGLTSEGRYISYNRDVVLDFPYKDAVLVGNQSREEQEGVSEKFYNEVLAADEIDRLLEPKAFSDFVRHTTDGAVSMAADDTINVDEDNLIVQGNNLLVLHSLRARYAGQVKLIYIDVPYNTGSDSFAYNDKFNRSTWLTFMKNRLSVAKDFLRPDGSIFIQLNDAQMAYLKVLCDEVFGATNFLNCIALKTRDSSGVSGKDGSQGLRSNKEYILLYARDKNSVALNTLTVESDFAETLLSEGEQNYRHVLLSVGSRELIAEVDSGASGTVKVYAHKEQRKATVQELARENGCSEIEVYTQYFDRVYRTTNAQSSIRQLVITATQGRLEQLFSIDYVPLKGKNAGKPTTLYYSGNQRDIHAMFSSVASLRAGKIVKQEPLSDFWDDIKFNGIAKEGGVVLKNGKKPERLLHRIISMGTDPGDLVLDFFLGSGTTAAVAHKMCRRYIGIEQLAYGENSAETRLAKVIAGEQSGISTLSTVAWAGGGSFVSMSLLGRTEGFKSRVMSATEADIDTLVEDMSAYSMYLDYRFRPEVLTSPEFTALSLEQKKTVLMRALDKNNLYVNYADIEDSSLKLSDADKALNHKFYGSK